MRRRRLIVAAALAALVVGVATLTTALTAAATVNGGRVGQSVRATGANDIKPAACAPNTLTNIALPGALSTTGTAANDLALGGPLAITISALGGDDCLVAASVATTLNGGPGFDVCIGGPGLDVFLNCEVQIQ